MIPHERFRIYCLQCREPSSAGDAIRHLWIPLWCGVAGDAVACSRNVNGGPRLVPTFLLRFFALASGVLRIGGVNHHITHACTDRTKPAMSDVIFHHYILIIVTWHIRLCLAPRHPDLSRHSLFVIHTHRKHTISNLSKSYARIFVSSPSPTQDTADALSLKKMEEKMWLACCCQRFTDVHVQC